MSHSFLANPRATKEVLERFGHSPKKSLGQNFLIDDNVIGRILELADVDKNDYVLEVGPGIGTLTFALLERAGAVVSVERDKSLPEVLRYTLSHKWDTFNLVEKDALDVTRQDLFSNDYNMPNKLVSNLPYAVAATIVLDYFERFDSIESMTVMVQKEVADRMQATPGTKNYGAYTVKLAMLASPVKSFLVKPSCFMPAPHVDSTVIRLDKTHFDDLSTDGSSQYVDSVKSVACILADAAFYSRRKTISNSMKQFFAVHPHLAESVGCQNNNVDNMLEHLGVDRTIRGETLSPTDYLNLAVKIINK